MKKEENKTPEFGLPETFTASAPNEWNAAGTFLIFAIGDKIEVKARGLTREQVGAIFRALVENKP